MAPTFGAGPLQFLGVDLPGAIRIERLRNDLSRLEAGPAQHIRLPTQGSLYRTNAAGETTLMLIAPDGGLQPLISVADAGGPSLLAGVHVARDGSGALVATDLAAGGDVYYVPIAPAGPALNLTDSLPPLQVDDDSLRLGAGVCWFLADGLIHRAPTTIADGARAVAVTLSPGEFIHGETVVAADGTAMGFVTEETGGGRHLHVVGSAGPASRLSTVAAAFDLPQLDSDLGPNLALSSDGSHVAWRETLLAKKELFVDQTALPGGPDQVTGDLQFTDTLDNVGILGFKGPDILIFATGEADLLGIDKADIYTVNATLGTAPVNVSLTSGLSAPPYDVPGELTIIEMAYNATGDYLIMHIDPDNGDYAMIGMSLDGTTGFDDLVPDLLEVPEYAPAGDSVLLITRPAPPASVDVQIHQLDATGNLTLLGGAAGAAGLIVDRFTMDRSGSKVGFVVGFGPGVQLPALLDVGTSSLSAAWTLITDVGPALAFSPTGRLAAGVSFVAGGPYLSVGFTGGGGGVLYGLPVAQGFPLAH